MNDLTKENIMIDLCNALADKNLMQKDVAANFGTDSASISNVKNPTGWKRVPQTLWADLDEWRTSGKNLRGYVPQRLVNAPPEEEPEPAPEPSIYDQLEAQRKKAGEKKGESKSKTEPQPEQKPEQQSVPQPEPKKEPSVTKGAKKFLKGEKAEKLDEKPEEKITVETNPNLEFDKAMKETIAGLNNGVIIPIPIGIHKYTPEPNVISQKFDIEVEVSLRIKEKK